MKKKELRVLIASLCVVGHAQAFIYHAHVLRKWDALEKAYHYIIGCSDFHGNADTVSTAQRSIIETVLGACKKDQVKIIVEDLSSPGSGGRSTCGRFFLGPKGGILSGLGKQCRDLGLDVENVEYRYCRVVALGPVMDRIRQDLSTCDTSMCSTCQTSVRALLAEITDIMHEVHAYDDHPMLNVFYAHCVHDAATKCQELHFARASALSVADYIAAHINDKQRLGQLKHLFTFDSALLDAKILHVIAQHANKKKIVAIAGGSHISAVCGVLEKVGYEKVFELSAGPEQEPELNSCVNSNGSAGHATLKPKPISMDFLQKYMALEEAGEGCVQ
jgi:hypothetical protein